MILRVALDLPEDRAYVRMTRNICRALLEDNSIELSDIDDVEVIVGELCTNVIRHSGSATHHYTVTFEYHHARIVVTVADTGKGFDPILVPSAGTVRPDQEDGERIGGFGMPLLKALATHLEFTTTVPSGVTVRAEKALRYQTQMASEEAARRCVSV